MKILVKQLDGKFPNLALLKLAGYHRRRLGDEVKRDCDPGWPDRVYASVVFTENRNAAERLLGVYPGAAVGGPGWDLSINLPAEVERGKPDYEFWGLDYSLGFTSRGCPRRCPWCVVPEKEGGVRSVASIPQLLGPGHRKLILLDNNFGANPDWRTRLHEIEELGLKVCFTQGLDIRLVDEEFAARIAGIRFYNWRFTHRRLYFSFDRLGDEDAVRRGIKLLAAAGVPLSELLFYVLVNYRDEDRAGRERFEILDKLGIRPFIMVYGDGSEYVRRFARTVNRRWYAVRRKKEAHGALFEAAL